MLVARDLAHVSKKSGVSQSPFNCGPRLFYHRLPVGDDDALEVPSQQCLRRTLEGPPVIDGQAKENADAEQARQPRNMPDKKTRPTARGAREGKKQVRHNQSGRTTEKNDMFVHSKPVEPENIHLALTIRRKLI